MQTSYSVDLNADVGESFGTYHLGNDEALMPYITSANIACGFHAGDPMVMKKTVELAIRHKVAIGAHPGLQDLAGFGRRSMAVSLEEVYSMVLYQVGALWAFVQARGSVLHHVKPHGALYNMAAVNKDLAEAIAQAVYGVNKKLILYGLSGSELIKAGKNLNLATASEVFADRTYQPDGTLTPRTQPQALITDWAQAVKQVLRAVKEGKVLAVTGKEVALQADTICIHGDGAHAAAFARHIREALHNEQIAIHAPGTAQA